MYAQNTGKYFTINKVSITFKWVMHDSKVVLALILFESCFFFLQLQVDSTDNVIFEILDYS